MQLLRRSRSLQLLRQFHTYARGRRTKSSELLRQRAREGLNAQCVAVLGTGTATFCLYHTWNMTELSSWPAEHPWLSPRRSAFSTDRAVAIFPVAICICSSVLATALALRCPRAAVYCKVPSSIHEFLVIPMAMMLAFRFDKAYERWWTSRHDIDHMASTVIGLATLVVNNRQRVTGGNTGGAVHMSGDRDGQLTEFLHAFCLCAAEALVDKEDGGTTNENLLFNELEDAIGEEQADHLTSIQNLEDRCLAILSKFVRLVNRRHLWGKHHPEYVQYSDEVESQIYEMNVLLVDQLRSSLIMNKQHSPAPYVVHMRTFLLLFCVTMPFRYIGVLRPVFIVPCTILLTFSLLGIEFCAQEMEHPLGGDEWDVPIRAIFGEARAAIRVIDAPHSWPQPNLHVHHSGAVVRRLRYLWDPCDKHASMIAMDPANDASAVE